MATANTCDPQLRTHLESYDYWVECIPCEFKSEESPSIKDATVAMSEHMISAEIERESRQSLQDVAPPHPATESGLMEATA